ncbi:DNA polymerase III subunit beta [Treponema parvum]|uniref:Beta sliding clamp n=1 Tax=Treponema parvum TaxID=138851 RepID=A0A975F1W2_9SPIR|nr:DNA polymerase III subunit beta [Treponema parvum]QTQ12964.1 DNA polymerase III subunit beta [Treponema parvum]
MKFSFDRDSMIKEIAIAQEIITNKSPISILSNILLEASKNTLTIKASDTSVNFITHIPVNVEEEGSTTIYCDKFMSILSSLPQGEIEFEQEDIKVTIRPVSKKIKFQLKSIAGDKFPEIASTGETFFEVSAKDFKEMISQTIFSVSEDGNRYFMTGVFFTKKEENLVMVATDGRRLSYIEKDVTNPVPDFPSSIVPVKILNCVLKNASDEGNILVSVIDKMIFIKFGNYEFSSLLLDGQFPNYQRVIPEKQSFHFKVYKNDLEEALKRTALMIDKKICRLLFKISPGVLKLISPESDIGTADEEIPCEYAGNEITLALNYRYIGDPLKVIKTDKVVFEFTEVMKAITLRSDPAADYFHIIMPMNFE